VKSATGSLGRLIRGIAAECHSFQVKSKTGIEYWPGFQGNAILVKPTSEDALKKKIEDGIKKVNK
jgi:hypothetical protein